jgi:DNA excision repair protein ERCC-2
MALYFRHDSPRPGQKELMEDMQRAINYRQIILAHAPTGSGKTDAALSAAVSVAIEQDLDIFFLTSKISQHKIALDVVRGIEEKHHLGLRAVDMVGRTHCCIDDSLRGMDSEGLLSACIKKRQNAECVFFKNARGYNRREEMKAEERFRGLLEGYGSGKSHHELIERGRSEMSCPYEWLLKLAAVSRVVVADYHHIFMPHIRDIFLQKIKKRMEKSIIIVDEAHNLAPRVRSSLSRNASTLLFSRVGKEMKSLGLDAGPLEEEFRAWSQDALTGAKERVVSPEDFTGFIGRFGLSIEEAVQRAEDAGNAYVEKTGRKSACLRLARFLMDWEGGDAGCVRILRREHGHYFLSKRMLDPSSATRILNDCAASILMSGTMIPMEMHRDVLGLDKERSVMKAYPSPFASSNIVNVIAEGLTTRYTRRGMDEYSAIAAKIDAIISRTPGGTAVFFPSYEVMDSVLPLVLSRNLHIQRPGMKPGDIRKVLRDFRSGGVLVGVQGGSLSEGVDYPEGEIKTVIIVGVALEEMGLESRALIDYYDAKFGRGWDYGYLYPGTIKALQAAGRARRKESDRVAVVYMDERFKWNKYNWILSRDERAVVTGSPEEAVGEFWECEDAADREIRPEKTR